MASILDIIKKKQSEIAAKKAQNLKTIKPQPGKHTYRILPGWRVDAEGNRDPQFWHDFGMHWIKESKESKKPLAVYVCTEKTFGEDHPCQICAAIGRGISSSNDDKMIEVMKESNAGQRYLLNVLHRTAAEPDMRDTPQVLEIGGTIFEQVCEFIAEYGDITDASEGIDLIIKREGSGFDTTYTVLPAKTSQKVTASTLEKLNNIDAYVTQESKPALAKALTAFGTVAGIAVAATAALPSAAAAISHDDLIDEDMPDAFSDSEEVEDAVVVSESDLNGLDELDELDELLAAE